MKLAGAQVAVIGMARSGVAAVEFLLEQGARVRAVDKKPVTMDRLAERGIAIQPQTEAALAGADLIVLSPGVPAGTEVVEAARRRGVRIIGDLELASWYLQGGIIGITGSNGKTTTTALTGHILQSSGIAAQVGGNIGTPPCSLVKTSREDQWNVLELSSFQLETIESFHARIAAALNVTPDHLDRHHTFERYAAAKARVFENQMHGDFAVLNADDPVTRQYALAGAGQPVWFSSTRAVSPGAWLEGDGLILYGEALMRASEVPLRGVHNLENVLAAALIAHSAGATPAAIRAAVMTFQGVEHRLERIGEWNGIAWYNDSKATNVDATLKAVAAFPGNLWVILGGYDKNADFTPLAAPLKEKAHAALLIGATAEKLESQLHGAAATIRCATLEEAVRQARARARAGDTVLLAPACASWDQFENFEHRGREFKRMVREGRNGQA